MSQLDAILGAVGLIAGCEIVMIYYCVRYGRQK